jgi:hypothetical protein
MTDQLPALNRPMPALNTFCRGIVCAALCALGGAVAAATPPAKPAKSAKPAASKAVKKAAPAKPVEASPIEADAEQIQAADRVYYGAYDCEFQQTVHIEKNPKFGSYVDVRTGKLAWTMKPVLSSTGAIRLEDVKGETLMVQISSKSMLLNVKTARRIVDECISPKQRELIEAAKVTKAAELASGSSSGAAPLLMAPSAVGGSAATAESPVSK